MNYLAQFPFCVRSLVVVILCCLLTLPMQAQFCLGTAVRPAEDVPNEVLVDITTENFTNILSLQFSVNFDAAIYELIGLEESDILKVGDFSDNPSEFTNGLRVAWIEPTVTTGESLPAGQHIATFRFKKINAAAGTFEISNDPVIVEIIDKDLNELSVLLCNSGDTLVQLLNGRLIPDDNENCSAEQEEIVKSQNQSWRGWSISATQNGQTNYSGGDFRDGQFSLRLFSGINEIEVIRPSPYYTTCTNSFTVDTENLELDNLLDVLVQVSERCPLLNVDIFSLIPETCGTTPIYLSYSNNGTVAAENAYIELDYDERLSPMNSGADVQSPQNSIRLDIGTVQPGEGSFILVEMDLSCEVEAGETICTEARIFPNELCGIDSPDWSGASLKVDSRCIGSEVIFEIENIGDGDMTTSKEFIVIEDAVIFRTQEIQLPQGGKETIRLAATGSTYRLQVAQEQGHPGNSRPTTFIEGCGRDENGNYSTGFASFFPNDDIDPFVDIDCQQVGGAIGERTAMNVFPSGFGETHLIEMEDYLEYQIFFENSREGIVVLDTLSELLDPLSFEPGTASQAYWYQIKEDGIVQFSIPAGSPVANSGFIKFKIRPKTDLPMGSKIFNSATVYRGLSEPISTNMTFHTIGENFLKTSTSNKAVFVQNSIVTIHPNPSTDNVWFTIKENHPTDYYLSIYDVAGTLVKQATFEDRSYELKRGELGNGLYIYKLIGADGKLDTGTFVLN